MKVVLRPEARAEVAAIVRWYEERRAGLGRDFFAVVDAVVAAIAQRPLRWPAIHGAVRRAITPRFPYHLFYVVDGEHVVVLRCRHTAQRPLR